MTFVRLDISLNTQIKVRKGKRLCMHASWPPSAALALAGGVAGVVLGVAASFIAARVSGWSFSVAYYTLPLGSGVATLVGVVFGLYPAVKASRLDPIEALRAE